MIMPIIKYQQSESSRYVYYTIHDVWRCGQRECPLRSSTGHKCMRFMLKKHQHPVRGRWKNKRNSWLILRKPSLLPRGIFINTHPNENAHVCSMMMSRRRQHDDVTIKGRSGRFGLINGNTPPNVLAEIKWQGGWFRHVEVKVRVKVRVMVKVRVRI